MYLDLLNEGEKIAFSRLAYLLISYYGIDEHEEKLYYAALAEMGLGEPDLEGEIHIEVECGAFQSMASRRIALLELMLMALADGDLDDDEAHMLDAIINEFRFPTETLEQAWGWVRSWYLTHKIGKDFIEMGELQLT